MNLPYLGPGPHQSGQVIIGNAPRPPIQDRPPGPPPSGHPERLAPGDEQDITHHLHWLLGAYGFRSDAIYRLDQGQNNRFIIDMVSAGSDLPTDRYLVTVQRVAVNPED